MAAVAESITTRHWTQRTNMAHPYVTLADGGSAMYRHIEWKDWPDVHYPDIYIYNIFKFLYSRRTQGLQKHGGIQVYD